MGEYAEMAIERDWYSSIFDEEDHIDVVVTNDYPSIDKDTLQIILADEDGFLLRKRNGDYNIFAKCIWQGEKSILCVIQDYGERNDIGRKFFIPKSIIKYNKKEKRVLYVPNWAKLKYAKDAKRNGTNNQGKRFDG